MSNQYEVLGKAPGAEDLKNLSSEDIFCLAHGKMLANGSPDEIKNNKRVVDAYLGAQ